jgi:glucokinase
VSAGGDGGCVAVGVDLGGTKTLGVAVRSTRAGAQVVASHAVPTPLGAPAQLDAVVELVEQLGASVDAGTGAPSDAVPTDALPAGAGARSGAGVPVGVAVAGLVDHDGVVRFAANLPGVLDVGYAAPLRARLPGPVVVDNDANAAAHAELRLGVARDARHAVLVTLGTGIGSAVVVDGAVLRGRAGLAGEAGHMVVDPSGPPCPCGRRGCWERFASGAGLLRLARDAADAGRLPQVVARVGGDPTEVRAEHVTEAALAGDAAAVAVIDELAWWVALGLANLVDLLDSELIVIGGGLVAAGEVLLAPVRAAFADLVLGGGHRPPVRIEEAALGPSAGAVGAALLALDAGIPG